MLKVRIIPCLDVDDGRVVKGVNFVDLVDAGNPVELAAAYAKNGADELVFLDITATVEGRETFADLVLEISKEIDIPFTVGGGIDSPKRAEKLLRNGADKISLNSSILKNPELLNQMVAEFGSQCIVAALDVKSEGDQHFLFTHGGRKNTGIKLWDWLAEVEERGAGELLLTSMDKDGTKSGFDNDLLALVSERSSLPVIASGGAGTKEDFFDCFTKGKADAALAASVFHFGEIPIPELKDYLKNKGINIRI